MAPLAAALPPNRDAMSIRRSQRQLEAASRRQECDIPGQVEGVAPLAAATPPNRDETSTCRSQRQLAAQRRQQEWRG